MRSYNYPPEDRDDEEERRKARLEVEDEQDLPEEDICGQFYDGQ